MSWGGRLLGSLYEIGVQVDRALTKSLRLPRPVVSVGNIAVGGRGKTPFIIEVATKLLARGLRPVVLSRGYGREESERRFLLPSERHLARARDVGDEPLEIAWRARVPVLVGAQRAAAALEWLAKGNDVSHFLLDDGFQHWKLERDLDVVLTDPVDDKDDLLPIGRLRERPAALERAHINLRRGRDFDKHTRLVCSRDLVPGDAGVVTTRAPDAGFASDIEGLLGPRDFHVLRDHATRESMLKAMRARSAWILGPKEAVKLLEADELEEFFATGVRRNVRAFGGSVFGVEPELDFRNAEFWDRFLSRVESLDPRGLAR